MAAPGLVVTSRSSGVDGDRRASDAARPDVHQTLPARQSAAV